MSKRFEHMLSPITIGGVTFKNRVWTGPAAMFLLQNGTPEVNDEVIAYYAEKAKGGNAVVTVSGQNMDFGRQDQAYHGNWNILLEEYKPSWKKLTDAIHTNGAKASLELLAFSYHLPDRNGRWVEYSINGEYGTRPLDRPAMEQLAKLYAASAQAALDCGFDMILIHGGHGLPLANILSPVFNRRRDEFGGSLENRAKFPIMILDAIREQVGRKLLIEYRISGDEYAEDGGFQVGDCIEFLKLVQDKIDIAHISAGGFATGTDDLMAPSNFEKTGRNTYLAEAVKSCPDIHLPVLTLGAYQQPEDIEKVLAEGKADIVATVRGSIADPALVRKAMENRADEVIPCIRCFHCLDYGRCKELACSVNPTVGRESVLSEKVLPADTKKKVVVIGGGPSGMQAAITAQQRGHEVILLEKGSRLGGTLTIFDDVPFKQGLVRFRDYLIHMVEKTGVDVRLNTEADAEAVKAMQADVVITALGAGSKLPDIPEIDDQNVITAAEAVAHPERIKGKTVAVIGGGETGCETALHLAMDKGFEVVLVGRNQRLAKEAGPIAGNALMKKLQEHLTGIYPGIACRAIDERGVIVEQRGKQYLLPADTVVIASGVTPKLEEAARFTGTAPQVVNIGDSETAGNVRTAVRAGFDAARNI